MLQPGYQIFPDAGLCKSCRDDTANCSFYFLALQPDDLQTERTTVCFLSANCHVDTGKWREGGRSLSSLIVFTSSRPSREGRKPAHQPVFSAVGTKTKGSAGSPAHTFLLLVVVRFHRGLFLSSPRINVRTPREVVKPWAVLCFRNLVSENLADLKKSGVYEAFRYTGAIQTKS